MRIFVYECVCADGVNLASHSSLLREGHAMLSAIAADLARLPDVQVVTLISEELSYEVGHECVRAPAGEESELFAETAASCDGTLVIAPECGDSLRDRSQAVLDVGARLLGSSPEAITLTGDKLALAEYWRLRRVPHPFTESFAHVHWKYMTPPWVLKPRDGAGSQAVYLVHDALSAFALATDEQCAAHEFLVQEWVPGQPVSVAFLIGKLQTISLAPCRQHLSDDGRFRYLGGSLPLPTTLAQRATRLALEAVEGIAGLRGYVGVDLVLGDDGKDYAIEINPRLTTSYLGLRHLCEQNLAEQMLRCAAGERMESLTWRPGEVQFEP